MSLLHSVVRTSQYSLSLPLSLSLSHIMHKSGHAYTLTCAFYYLCAMCSFSHLGYALKGLFGLFTTESYPDMMLPALRTSRWSFIYFGIFMILSFFYVTPMISAHIMVIPGYLF